MQTRLLRERPPQGSHLRGLIVKVAIFGLGYVGSTAAGCIASQGHTIIGVDVSDAKVAALNEGRAPVYEPGLDDLLAAAHAEGRVKAVTKLTDELDDADMAIVCVGTPSGVDGAHNMSYIAQVTRAIAAAIKPDRTAPLTLAYRWTMRPGSCENIIWPIIQSHLGDAAASAVGLVSNPEFLREATAIEDFFHPPKIVIGTLGRSGTRIFSSMTSGKYSRGICLRSNTEPVELVNCIQRVRHHSCSTGGASRVFVE